MAAIMRTDNMIPTIVGPIAGAFGRLSSKPSRAAIKMASQDESIGIVAGLPMRGVAAVASSLSCIASHSEQLFVILSAEMAVASE